MNRFVRTLIVALGAAGCAHPTSPAPAVAAAPAAPWADPGPWTSAFGVAHPLVGRIWDVANARYVTEDAMIADLKAADHVLLGEKHDNPDHHRLQGEIIAALAPPAVAFEMLDHDDPVDGPTDPDALAAAVGWDTSGWPPFAIYRPVFEALYAAHARVVAGHPTRDEVKTAMNDGFAALPAEATAGLALDRALADAAREDLSGEIVASHCGHASPEVVDKMIRAQVLKDAWMARALDQAGPHSALVAGGGHARADRGVPWYLADPAASRTVQLVEVDDAEQDPAAYDRGARYLWFTPRVDDEDPCEAFRAQLEKMEHQPPAPAAPAPAAPAP